MAENAQIRLGADIGGALAAVDTLKRVVAAAQQSGSAALTAFRADLQRMVAEHSLSLRQALGFDIEYTAQRGAQERARLADALSSDAASLSERAGSYAALVDMSSRYTAQVAQDQRHMAEAARREADRLALPYRQAFDDIGVGWRSAVTGLVEGTLTFQGAALRVAQSVERGFIDMVGTALSRATAGPVASLLGLPAPIAGEGLGGVLGDAVSGLFGFLGGIFAFRGGGVVPSAARGWALPNFAGARPALLHAREMVLPAPISEGLQRMIADGSGGGDMHLHFHGPSDGPAVERWFTGLMARNPDVVRNMMRSNALTPRTL